MSSPCTILRRLTAPQVEAVLIEEAKAAARIQYAVEDELVRTWINAAAELAQVHTDGRQLITATYALDLDRFPCGRDPIELPRPPLQSVESITYYDAAGDQQTLASSDYFLIVPENTAGAVYLDPLASWPATQCERPNAVTVSFTAGYGDTPDAIPAALKYGIILCASYWNLHRDTPLDVCPPGAIALFRTCRAG